MVSKKNGKVKIQIWSRREEVVDGTKEKPVEFTIVTRSISFVVKEDILLIRRRRRELFMVLYYCII